MRKTVAVLCSMLALLAACGTSGDSPSAVEAHPIDSSATADGAGRFRIDWGKKDKGLQPGTIEVPVDHDDPSQGTFTLHLLRHLAGDGKKKIGTLLVNPGGPGFGGLSLARDAKSNYDKDLLAKFDILAWDPRGTGTSTPAIDCYDDYDHVFDSADITPDTDAERQDNIELAEEVTDDCETKNAAILQHVGTNDSARDMDAIRQALGEEQISYFGFSYGSELGATWATLFPATVRAAVLDGAADPGETLEDGNLAQMKGFEAALDTFLAQCSNDSGCTFHNDGDAEGAFDALMAKIDENPLPALDGAPSHLGAAITAVIRALYSDAFWPVLAQALDDAQAGDGSLLMQLYDDYYQRQADGTYANTIEAFSVISCMDTTDRPTVAEADAFVAQLTAVAPRLAPAGSSGDYMCTFFPPTDEARTTITGAGAGPIVVIGTTGDPSTPLDSSRAMADTLQDGVLVVVHANQHTGYNVNDCVNDAVDNYLVDPTDVPDDGLECT